MDKESLKKKTVAELREMAKEIPDVKGISTMKKDALVDLLAGHAGSKDEKTGARDASATETKAAKAAPSPTKPRGPLGKTEIKERIRALKTEKREALDQHDQAKIHRCNRQIHNYKRQLRKMARTTKSK
jgi:hypothetical protein